MQHMRQSFANLYALPPVIHWDAGMDRKCLTKVDGCVWNTLSCHVICDEQLLIFSAEIRRTSSGINR